MSLADSGPFLAVAVLVYLADGLPEHFEHHLSHCLVLQREDGVKLAG